MSLSNQWEDQMKQIASRAAKVMDKVSPGWHNQVDVNKLDMSSCQTCMLGQVFGIKAELAVAKETHPEEWRQAVLDRMKEYLRFTSRNPEETFAILEAKSNDELAAYIKAEHIDGYSIGLNYVRIMNDKQFINADDQNMVRVACGGNLPASYWKVEICSRVKADLDAEPDSESDGE